MGRRLALPTDRGREAHHGDGVRWRVLRKPRAQRDLARHVVRQNCDGRGEGTGSTHMPTSRRRMQNAPEGALRSHEEWPGAACGRLAAGRSAQRSDAAWWCVGVL